MTYGGRVFQEGDAVARSWIIEAGSADKLGVLQRTGYVQDVGFVGGNLSKRTKAELVEKAHELGVEVSSAWRKQDLIDAVEYAL